MLTNSLNSYLKIKIFSNVIFELYIRFCANLLGLKNGTIAFTNRSNFKSFEYWPSNIMIIYKCTLLFEDLKTYPKNLVGILGCPYEQNMC